MWQLSCPGSILAVSFRVSYYKGKQIKLLPTITIQMWFTCLCINLQRCKVHDQRELLIDSNLWPAGQCSHPWPLNRSLHKAKELANCTSLRSQANLSSVKIWSAHLHALRILSYFYVVIWLRWPIVCAKLNHTNYLVVKKIHYRYGRMDTKPCVHGGL